MTEAMVTESGAICMNTALCSPTVAPLWFQCRLLCSVLTAFSHEFPTVLEYGREL